MNIALFSMSSRIAIAIAAVVLVLATLIAVKRGRARLGAIVGVGALAAIGALAGEALVALTVRLAAPAATDFNEYRWVFLSPYGRWGLYIGIAVVAAIVLLSWRSSRGASVWRDPRRSARGCGDRRDGRVPRARGRAPSGRARAESHRGADRRQQVDVARGERAGSDAHRARAPADREFAVDAARVGARPQDRLLHVRRDRQRDEPGRTRRRSSTRPVDADPQRPRVRAQPLRGPRPRRHHPDLRRRRDRQLRRGFRRRRGARLLAVARHPRAHRVGGARLASRMSRSRA